MFIEKCCPFFLEFHPNGIEEQTYRPYQSMPHARLAFSGTEAGVDKRHL